MPTNDEIWKKLKSECGTIDTSDCGTLEGEEDYVECDDEYICPKHKPQFEKYENDIANAFRADAIKLAISHMRIARSSMCLKDRAILLNEINLLEIELKKLEA